MPKIKDPEPQITFGLQIQDPKPKKRPCQFACPGDKEEGPAGEIKDPELKIKDLGLTFRTRSLKLRIWA